MEYKIWRSTYVEGFCVIEPPEIDDEWELDDGQPRAANHPDDVQCAMDSEYPHDIQLSDNLYGAGMPIISEKLKDVLAGNVRRNRVEYLRVRIINHKGRMASADYFVLHPLDVCDCIDLDRSGIEWNQITSDLITGCQGLVLKHEVIPNDFILFRPKYWGANILVRSDLVDALLAADLTGLGFIDAQGYTGMG